MKIEEVEVNRFISKSEIEGVDFVVNSYVGCPNGCIYCYAAFMQRLSGHLEEWGNFIDVKMCNYKLRKQSVEGKTYLMSSTTDCYNSLEAKYELTRNILKQLIKFNFNLIIETKNDLILRDIDLLKEIKNLKIIISLNTLDDGVRSKLENNSSIESRLNAIKELSKNNFQVSVGISPILPFLTDYKEIIKATKDYVCEYKFEFLKLKDAGKRKFLKFISENYNEYYLEYAKIYLLNDNTYFVNLKKEIEDYCNKEKINYYFN